MGYDNEVRLITDDLLQRDYFAKRIFQNILDTPNDWSVRIGIYGAYGTGKSTLINLINNYARRENYPVIKLNVGTFSTPNELWGAFFTALLTGLESLEYDIQNAIKWGWLPEWLGNKLSTSMVLNIYTISKYVNKNINHSISNSALNFVAGNLEFKSDFFASLKKQLDGKKIIFEIDDFDRLPPELVPQFLIALREILDLPCFAFILAMDRDKVANAIESRYHNFGAGYEFLEKIIDFPYPLPTPSATQIEAIFCNQLNKVVGIDTNIDYKPLVEFFPKNPRKLKLVTRNIKILKDELSRHGEEEIKWVIILFLCVLKSKSQHAYDIITQQLTNDDIHNVMFIDDDNKRAGAINNEIIKIYQSCKDVQEDDEELKKLIEYFFENYYYFRSNNLHYFVNLIINPHFLTWKEFYGLLDSYEELKSSKTILDWITTTEKQSAQNSRSDIVAELFESSVNHYGHQLENAAGTDLVADHGRHVECAKKALPFITELFNTIDEYDEREFFIFLDKAISWQHFNVNESDVELRRIEKQVFLDLLTTVNRLKRIELFYGLVERRNNLSKFPFGERNDRPKLDFVNFLLEQVTEILNDLQSELKKEDAMRMVKSANGYSALGYILLSNESILFKNGSIKHLDDLASQADTDMVLFNNLKIYFDLLCEHISHGRLNREVAILVAPILWRAITSRELQFRVHSRLFQQRTILINAGVGEGELPQPQWLTKCVIN
tara:strand:+ start:279 stop:2447 length:2169 start_codon:yes stop_codon:yes gene_type:complete